MPLPQVIELLPLAGPVSAEVVVPGSKSVTNRALVLAALAGGTSVLEGALWSEDTQVMVESLQSLGFSIDVTSDVREWANRRITIIGQGGRLLAGGTPRQPKEIFAGNAGTAARFLTALLCLGSGVYRISGTARMHERPQISLFQALRQLGYRIDSETDRLPALIYGKGPQTGTCSVSITESSQFASALYLCADAGGWHVEVEGENEEESSYVLMTRHLCEQFPRSGGLFQIEPDASSGSYFWAAGYAMEMLGRTGHIQVAHWPTSGWQVDARFPCFWPLPATVSRQRDLGDSIMTAIVLAPLADHPVEFVDLGRLRVQECERVKALKTELTKCGAQITEIGNALQITPSSLHGALIDTYNDHRMAMCFGVLGLVVPGIKISHPACVKKTFPNFFQKLACPPPNGLGVAFCDAASGRRINEAELLVE